MGLYVYSGSFIFSAPELPVPDGPPIFPRPSNPLIPPTSALHDDAVDRQFSPGAAAYLTSAVHAQGEDSGRWPASPASILAPAR